MTLGILAAIEGERPDKVKVILENLNSPLDHKEELERSIFASVERKYVDVLEMLLQIKGVNVDYHDPTYGSALAYLCCHPNKNCRKVEEMARLLLKYKADMDQVDADGNPMLIVALMHDQRVVLQLLIDYLPDMLKKNKNGETALYLAAQCGKLNELSWLYRYSLRFGYDIDLGYLRWVAKDAKQVKVERFLNTMSKKGDMFRASLMQMIMGSFFMVFAWFVWDEDKTISGGLGLFGLIMSLPEIPNVLHAKLPGYAISAKDLGPVKGEAGCEAYEVDRQYMSAYLTC